MQGADVENPNPNPGPGGGDMFAVTQEPDVNGQFCPACCLASMVCAVLPISAALVLLFCYTLSVDAAVVFRVLAAAGLVAGVLGLGFGTLFCTIVVASCVSGNV